VNDDMAQMTAASIDDLPDSDFAYIEPGGKKDDEGKTTPRSLRHFPIHDAAHVRNALARLSQSPFGDKARAKVEAAAKKMGIGEPASGKAVELKAEPMETSRLDRWLAGKISRRILVAPFYGPIPGADGKGRDLDGEYFHPDEEDAPATDFYGDFPSLRATRDRLVDWHHTTFMSATRKDPMGQMKGAILGNLVLDEDTEQDGLWADFWANAGEQRRKLVAMLEKRGAQLFGSSQPVQAGIVKADGGRIDVWPIRYHTITTSPQNTAALMPALKAALGSPSLDEIPADAVKAFLTGLDDSDVDLLSTSPDAAVLTSALVGEAAAKSGRVLAASKEAKLRAAIEAALHELDEIVRQEALLPPTGVPEDERVHAGAG
jgi:hypothetical protein